MKMRNENKNNQTLYPRLVDQTNRYMLRPTVKTSDKKTVIAKMKPPSQLFSPLSLRAICSSFEFGRRKTSKIGDNCKKLVITVSFATPE